MIRNSRRMVVLAIAGAVAIAPVVSGCGAGEKPQSAAPTQLTEGVNVTVPQDSPGAPQIDLRNMLLLGPEAGGPVPAGTSMALYGVVINQVKGRQDRLVSVSSPAFGGEAKIEGGALTLPPAAADGTGSFTKLVGKPSATPAPQQQGGKKKTQQPGTAPSTAPSTGAPSGDASPEPTGQGATPNVSQTPTSQNTTGPQGGGPSATPSAGGEQPLVVLPRLNQELVAGKRVPLTMRFERAGSVEFQVPVVARQGEFSALPLPVSPATPQAPGGQTPGQTPGGEASTSPSPGTEQGGPESSPSPTPTGTPTSG